MRMRMTMTMISSLFVPAVILCSGCATAQPILQSLPAWDEYRSSNKTTTRIQSIDVVDDIPFCSLVMLMPFSGFRPTRIPLQNGVFQGMAAVLLAMEHLNTSNGTIVKELEGLSESCPITFTAEILDSALSQTIAVNHVIQLVSRDPELPNKGKPCAMIGAARSAVSIPTSILTGLQGIPQISPISTSTQLEDVSSFPLFGRTIPSDAGTAIPAILYLRYELGVKHLAVLHVNDAYGNAYALGLQLAAAEYAPDMVLQSYDFPFQATPDIAKRTISLLKQTNYRYFFGVFFSTVHYDPFMTEAYRQGIAGTGYHNWMFSDSVSTSVFADGFPLGSDLHLASRGSSRIGAVGGVPGIETYDLFLRSMQDLQNTKDINYIQSKHPTYPDEPDYQPYQIVDDDEFFVKASAGVVPFLYDAVIALGLAACKATTNTSTYFNGQEQFDIFKKNITFEGASGFNQYDRETGTRIASTARFTLLNFVEDHTEINKDDGTTIMRFQTVETNVFQDGEWTSIQPVVFNDGTTIPPPDLPEIFLNENFIGTPLRVAGLCMAGVILLLSLAFSLWTHVRQASRVIKASQPIFLHMINMGCAWMGTSIIFLSLDDEIASTQACTAFCIVFPWTLSGGWILAFSALFAKTSRVNKIILNPTFKRIKVTVWDVLKPVVVLMTVATLLLALWTGLAPPSWIREISEIDPYGRQVESKGMCHYKNEDGGLVYLSVLGVILLGILAYAVYEAYVARNLSTEFAESEYIALVLAAILLVSFLGIPVMIIAGDEPRARFFVGAAIVFVICMAILLLIFVPKIRAVRKDVYDLRQASTRNIGSRSRESIGAGITRRDGGRNSVHISGLDPQFDMSGRCSLNVAGVSGFDPQNDRTLSVINDSETEGNDDDTDNGGGIMILNHPKEIEDLKVQVTQLKSENALLQGQVKNLRQLHSKAQSLINVNSTVAEDGSSTFNLATPAGVENKIG